MTGNTSGDLQRACASFSQLALDEKAVLMAVSAHTRHAETNYDELLAQGWDRSLARDEGAIRWIRFWNIGRESKLIEQVNG